MQEDYSEHMLKDAPPRSLKHIQCLLTKQVFMRRRFKQLFAIISILTITFSLAHSFPLFSTCSLVTLELVLSDAALLYIFIFFNKKKVSKVVCT